jgi:hypothetical protein
MYKNINNTFKFEKNKNNRKENFILILFILTIVAFDPQNGLGFRNLIIVFFGFIWLINICKFKDFLNANELSLIFLIYLLPLYGAILYIIRGDGLYVMTDTSYISTSVVLTFVYLLNKKSMQEDFIRAAKIIGLLYVIIYASLFIEGIALENKKITTFLLAENIARVSFREYSGIVFPYIYLYTSTFLIVPLSILYYEINRLNNYKLGFYGLLVICLFLSGTRSHMLIAIIYAFLIYKKLFPKTSIIIFTAIILLNSQLIYEIIKEMFSFNEKNNNYKLNMIANYYDIFEDWKTLIFGQGYQAVNWSRSLQEMVSVETGATKTEITLLELLRVYGLPLSFLLITIILNKVNNLWKKNITDKKLILIFLLIDSMLNPHIFSTYGAIMLAYALSKNFNDRFIHLKNNV